jgi:hypothetical protein
LSFQNLSNDETNRVAGSNLELRDYIGAAIKDRRASPRDDLISHLVAVQDAEGSRLSDAEVVSIIVLLLFGGNTTTTDLIGNGILALLQHPDQLAALQADPPLLANTVEEILRFDPSITLAERISTTDVDIDGSHISPGEWLFLILTSANRDPALHTDPDRFDIRREQIHHVSFGGGRHLCLGSALARIETQIAIGSLVTRFPSLRLADPSAEPTTSMCPASADSLNCSSPSTNDEATTPRLSNGSKASRTSGCRITRQIRGRRVSESAPPIKVGNVAES